MVKPILFNTEMVQAILDGRKICARKLVRFLSGKNPNWTGYVKDGNMLYNGTNEPCIKPPYQAGDILYVRETFIQAAAHIFWYKAGNNSWMSESESLRWKSPIHMPKEAARIWLKVTDVRVERLQNISGEDLIKEGIDLFQSSYVRVAFDEFKNIWNSTIKKSDLAQYGWDANPYVWVIEFEKCEKPKE